MRIAFAIGTAALGGTLPASRAQAADLCTDLRAIVAQAHNRFQRLQRERTKPDVFSAAIQLAGFVCAVKGDAYVCRSELAKGKRGSDPL